MNRNLFFMIINTLCSTSDFCCEAITTNILDKKIVIIGAGLAGLTASHRLFQKGFDVQVYEAKNRVGGRILSAIVNDNVAELGGENIADGGNSEHINRLVNELGLKLFHSTTVFKDNFFYDNTLIPVNDLIKKHNFNLDTLKDKLDVIKKTSESMRDVLEKLFKADKALKICLSTRLAGYEGASVDQLSSSYVETLYYMLQNGTCKAHKSNETSFTRINDGNSKLPEAIAEKLGDRIHLEMPVASIAKNKQKQYIITFKNGSTTRADVLILAIPCPVYNDITFSEEVIPQERLNTIRRINNGDTAKIIVPISGTFARSNTFINDYLGIFTYVENIITLYFTGQSSKFLPATISQTYTKAQSLLACGFEQNSLPKQEPIIANDTPFVKYSGAVGYAWPNDQYAKGSYSYIAPGQEEIFISLQKHGDFEVKTLFAPIDKLYFVGEHTSTLLEIPGTMEAACQSGNLAADMIEEFI